MKHINGEFAIFNKKLALKWYKPKSFITRLAWRLLFKKVKLNDRTVLIGRCLECDARGENKDTSIGCNYFYCPCKFNEHLKLK